jgi:hypothetical protein
MRSMADQMAVMSLMIVGKGTGWCRRYEGMKGEPLLCHKLTPMARDG